MKFDIPDEGISFDEREQECFNSELGDNFGKRANGSYYEADARKHDEAKRQLMEERERARHK